MLYVWTEWRMLESVLPRSEMNRRKRSEWNRTQMGCMDDTRLWHRCLGVRVDLRQRVGVIVERSNRARMRARDKRGDEQSQVD